MGDDFVSLYPLISHARLYTRQEYIRDFKARNELIYRKLYEREYDTIKKEEGTSKQKNKHSSQRIHNDLESDHRNPKYLIDDETHKDVIKQLYKPIKGWNAVVRCIYVVVSFGGTIPDTWSLLSNSAATVVAISFTGVLSQLQSGAILLENNSNVDVNRWISNWIWHAFLVVMFCAVLFSLLRLVEYLCIFYKSNVRILHEARFEYIMTSYRQFNPNMAKYELEYYSKCDPDIAAMYFTLREQKENKIETGNFKESFKRLYRCLCLPFKEPEVDWPKPTLKDGILSWDSKKLN